MASNRPLSVNRSLWRRVSLENLLHAYRLVVSDPLALSRREVRGMLDLVRLERHLPEAIEFPKLASEWEDELREPYDDYTRNVSHQFWAISLRLATTMLVLCDISKPARLLDTGSGFSSYALRLWAARNGSEVTSVEYDPGWLRRTREYLEASSLPFRTSLRGMRSRRKCMIRLSSYFTTLVLVGRIVLRSWRRFSLMLVRAISSF